MFISDAYSNRPRQRHGHLNERYKKIVSTPVRVAICSDVGYTRRSSLLSRYEFLEMEFNGPTQPTPPRFGVQHQLSDTDNEG